MTPEARHKLLQAERDYYRANFPSVPGHGLAKSDFKDNSANNLTKCIVAYIRFTGGYAERVQRMGFKTKAKSGKEIWVSGGGTNGTADISAIFPGGQSVRIEVKYGTDRIRPNQIRYAERVKQAGALYFIARSFDEFLQWYLNINKS